MDIYQTLIAITLVAACFAVALTESVKQLINYFHPVEPPWYDVVLRSTSVVSGAVSALLALSLFPYPWYLLLVIGMGAGGQATWIVSTLKAYVGKRTG
jgi:hypothetical protein